MITEGKDIAIIDVGETTYYCLEISRLLKEKNISATFIDMPTVKTLDKETITRIVQRNWEKY